MLRACSHLVVATDDVPKMTHFFSSLFEINPYFENKEFSEFVLPSRFRIAFFRPVGASAKHFKSTQERGGLGIGLTVENVDSIYDKAKGMAGTQVSGPPKEHPWGEKSFLLIDPDGNRWELTQSPSTDGMLVNR